MIKYSQIRGFLLLSALFFVLSGIQILTVGTSFNEKNTADYSEIDSSIDYLIITSDSLQTEVQPLATWKRQKGLTAAVITTEEILLKYEGYDLSEAIRNCITHFHENNDTTWILLAGNDDYVPTRNVRIGGTPVVCDHYYSNLGDNWVSSSGDSVEIVDYHDWDNEVYLGRLPAENGFQMEKLVQRILDYEQNPPVGPWMTRAVCAGAFANFNYDVNDNSILDEDDYPEFDGNRYFNWIKTNIIPSDWNSTLLGEAAGAKTSDYYYDKPLTETNLVEEINNGVGIGMFDAHGSTTGMFRMIFNHDWDNDSLFDLNVDSSSSVTLISTDSGIDSEGKDGFYILNACSTGNFDYSGTGLAEYILLNCGIGVIASSRAANYEIWYEREHEGWVTQGLSARFWDQIFNQGVTQPGKAFVEAKLDYVSDYLAFQEIDDTGQVGAKTLAQYNLLGDPEIPIWTSIPSQLEANVSYSSESIIISVKSDNQPVSNAVVTLSGLGYYHRDLTNELGLVSIPLPGEDNMSLNLTLSKNNFLPYQQLLEDVHFTTASSDGSSSNQASAHFPLFAVFITVILFARRKREKNP